MQTILTGVDRTTLQLWLSQAQASYMQLMTGGKPVTVSYDGKSVTYTAAEAANLQAWITLLQRQLGIVGPRRALTPYFR